MAWVTMGGIILIGAGLVWEGTKGLIAAPHRERTASRGMACATLAVGVAVVIAGVAISLLAF
ncbi:MAG TPA: hypothetical protein VGE74_26720 [Gemmata sp.]